MREGWRPPRESSVPAYSKALAAKPVVTPIKEMERADRMNAQNRRSMLNKMDKVNKLFKDTVEVCAATAYKILDLKDARSGKDTLSRMAKDKLIVLSRKEKSTCYWRKA